MTGLASDYGTTCIRRCVSTSNGAHPASAAAAASYSDVESDGGDSAVREVEQYLARGDADSAAAALRAVREFVARETAPERKHSVADKPSCAICMDEIEMDAKPLPCMHVFHRPCIDRWLRRERSCPVCRKAVP